MNYRPNLGFEYPDRSDEHMITVKHLRDTNFDENYQYLPKGFWHKFSRAVLWVLLNVLVFFVVWIRHGVKIYGRDKLKKYKKELKDGAITVSNHVFMWDYLCLLMAIRPHLQYFPAWKTNFEGSNGPLIRWIGGIPVPTDNIRAMAKFQRAIGDVLKEKKWLHFFPEGSMWYYYPDVRPFKKAVFKYAVRHNRPIIPIGISYRPRKGLWKLIGKRPLINVTVGDPIFPDKSIPETEAIDKIHAQTYHTVQTLMGVNPGDPTYNTDQDIDHYKKTM